MGFVFQLIPFLLLIATYEMIRYKEKQANDQRFRDLLETTETERQDLYNRIMSKNAAEYTMVAGKREPSNKSKNPLRDNITKALNTYQE